MADVWEVLVDQLAYVRAVDRSELDASIAAAGGDLEVDSKEGQTVAIRVELLLDMEGLIKPEDQTREHLTSIKSLESLIATRLAEREQGG